MSLGNPNFGDLTAPAFNPLIYPRRILIEVLESVFSQPILVTYPGAPQNPFQFIPDGIETSKNSQIVIADTFSDEINKPDSRPTIIVSRGTFQFDDLAMNNRRDVNQPSSWIKVNKSLGYGPRTQAKYADLTTLGIQISCYSRRDTEVDQIAWIVAGALKFFKEPIKDGAHFHKITSAAIGPVVSVKSDAQHDMFMTQLNLLIYQTLSWVTHTTLSPGSISAGFTNLSGSRYPRLWSDSSPMNFSIIPNEVAGDSPLTDHWLYEN